MIVDMLESVINKKNVFDFQDIFGQYFAYHKFTFNNCVKYLGRRNLFS